MTTLDAIVVGAGAVGSGYDTGRPQDAPPLSHAGAYAAHPETRLVAAVDPGADARATFTESWSVPAYATLEEALAAHPGLALASVCTPSAARAHAVTALTGAGIRAIWAEKPLAPTTAEAREVVDACECAGIGLLVNFLRRFDPLHRRVAAMIAERGGARHIDVRYSGSLEDYATHGIDIVRWWAGEIVAATAMPLATGEALVALETKSGATAVLAQVRLGEVELFEVDVFAGAERLSLTGLGERLVRAGARPSEHFRSVTVLANGTPDDESGLQRAMIEGVSALVAFVRTKTPMPVTGADAVAALAVYEAIESSLAEGRRTELEFHT